MNRHDFQNRGISHISLKFSFKQELTISSAGRNAEMLIYF